MHDAAAKTPAQAWRSWKLPGDAPRCYAVYVDERDLADHATLTGEPQVTVAVESAGIEVGVATAFW